MTAISVQKCAVAALTATLAAACTTTASDQSEPRVVVQEVKVAVPVPCPALAQLGPEPIYVDAPDAIRQASGPAERAKLYVKGRAQRIQRLAEYITARTSCEF